MMLMTRTHMTGLMMAAALALAPVAGHASAPDYGTSNPYSGMNMGSVMEAQNMISSMSLAQANGFNIQGLASASLGSMLGSAVTQAMGLDGILGNVVQGVITAGVMQGMEKLSAGGSMGNFGGLLSASLTSTLLGQGGGIQGGFSTASNSFGGLSGIATAAATSVIQQAMSGGGSGGSGSQMLQTVATAAIAGGIQGAVANTASLTQ